MVNLASKIAIVIVAVVAIIYQFAFKHALFFCLGIGREISSISDYPDFQCEKIVEPGLEACEDLWLHQETGHLYLACSDTRSRTQWTPAVGFLNASARGLNDRIAILDTRGSGSVASRLKWMSVEDFDGITGDGSLNLHGMDIRVEPQSNVLHILLVNHRPPLDLDTGILLEAAKVGANSTIEHFTTTVGSTTMTHSKTFVDALIATPNRVAWLDEDSFLMTNDNGITKTGFRRELNAFLGSGNVVRCSSHGCDILYSKFWGANGLVRGHDGLIYVPNTLGDKINVFNLTEKNALVHFHDIKVPHPIDNLSVDKNGDIFAAGLPSCLQWLRSSKKPFEVDPPSSLLKVVKARSSTNDREGEGLNQVDSKGYSVEKIFEDDGSVLPGSTTIVHDAETGRFFFGGVISPFITICERKKH